MAIRMPQQRIAEYVEEHLQWLPLLTDEELVAELETVLLKRLDRKGAQPPNRIRIADLVGGPLFKTLGPQLQDRIMEKLEELEKRRRYRGGKQETNLGMVSLDDWLLPPRK